MTLDELQSAFLDLQSRVTVLEAKEAETENLVQSMRNIAAAAAAGPGVAEETVPAATQEVDETEKPLAVGDRVKVKAGDWGNSIGDITALSDDGKTATVHFILGDGEVELDLLERTE